MKLHHATVAKAEKADIIIGEPSEGSNLYHFSDSEGTIFAVNADPKAGLDQAIEAKAEGKPYSFRDKIMGDGYRETYRPHNDSCGDDVAGALTEATMNGDGKVSLSALSDVAKANEIDPTKYNHLNNGMQRMNIGNCLRGRLRKGFDVVIGDKTFKAENFAI